MLFAPMPNAKPVIITPKAVVWLVSAIPFPRPKQPRAPLAPAEPLPTAPILLVSAKLARADINLQPALLINTKQLQQQQNQVQPATLAVLITIPARPVIAQAAVTVTQILQIKPVHAELNQEPVINVKPEPLLKSDFASI